MKKLLVEKYRPETIDDIILDDNIKIMLKDKIKNKKIDNILLSGKAGIGKTSMAKILINELKSDYLYLNCGYENGIDKVRNKIKEFCDAIAMNDEVSKIVILDESDSLSNNAQEALRNIIEENIDDTRFIFTANFENKIITPLKSRCIPIQLSFSIKDVFKRIVFILNEEKIKYTKENIRFFLDNIIKKKYPDIRGIINNLELMILGNELTINRIDENKDGINKVVDYILEEKLPRKIRKFCIENEDLFSGNYEELFHYLFNKLYDKPEKQVLCADYLFRMSNVLDKEIQAFSFIIELKKL